MTDTINVKIVPDDRTKIISRELASLGLAIGVSILVVLVQRKVSDPDFVLTCRMRTLNTVARYADTRASFWRNVSENATQLYLESRP